LDVQIKQQMQILIWIFFIKLLAQLDANQQQNLSPLNIDFQKLPNGSQRNQISFSMVRKIWSHVSYS
jgi:hypothetical protein